jgi:hypothetical protein
MSTAPRTPEAMMAEPTEAPAPAATPLHIFQAADCPPAVIERLALLPRFDVEHTQRIVNHAHNCGPEGWKLLEAVLDALGHTPRPAAVPERKV